MNTRTIVSAIAECRVVASAFGEVTVDFAAQKGDVNPRLHSAHFCPRYSAIDIKRRGSAFWAKLDAWNALRSAV